MSGPQPLAFPWPLLAVDDGAPVVIHLDSSEGELEEAPCDFDLKDEQASPTHVVPDMEQIEQYDFESSVGGSQDDGVDTPRPPLRRLEPFILDELNQEPRKLRSFSGDEADVAGGPPNEPRSLFGDSGDSGIEGSESEDNGGNGDSDSDEWAGNSDSHNPAPHHSPILHLVPAPSSSATPLPAALLAPAAPPAPTPSSIVGGIRHLILRPLMSGGGADSPGGAGEASGSRKCRRIDVSVSVSVTDNEI